MSLSQTGNPVFDYRAAYRRRAGFVQTALLTLGVLALIAAGVLRIAHVLAANPAIMMACGGAGVFVAGFGWGIYWRRNVRQDFRETFGPE